jgi:hypothetical protein
MQVKCHSEHSEESVFTRLRFFTTFRMTFPRITELLPCNVTAQYHEKFVILNAMKNLFLHG